MQKPKERKAATRAKREGFAKEKDLQSLCEQYLTALQIPFLHIPSQSLSAAFHRRAMSGPELGAARAASEYVTGYPDITVYYRVTYYRCYELKSITGTMKQSQRHWQKDLGTIEIRTFEAFEADLKSWMGRCDYIENEFQRPGI